jgi:hypothetical protein
MLCRRAYRLAPYSGLASTQLLAPCCFVHTTARILKGDELGPTRDEPHQTLRTRKDGSAGTLPLPPLLDPVVLQKRSRWENTKAQPRAAELTPFQKRLQANAYGTETGSSI